MNKLHRISKNGKPILSLEDWKQLGGPKDPIKQWKAGRSAMEAARAWLGTEPHSDSMPSEILRCFHSHQDFTQIIKWEAEPEVRLHFDHYRGEPRNTDLAVIAKDETGDFFIGVEAKADEPFDKTVVKAHKAAIKARETNIRSKAAARIEELCQKILGRGTQECSDIYYQLLTATAGVIAETKQRKLKRGILIIHEFVTDKTDDKRHDENSRALNQFVNCLTGGYSSVADGELIGPIYFDSFKYREQDCSDVALYIGKARRYLR